jgi:hypothetical protein
MTYLDVAQRDRADRGPLRKGQLFLAASVLSTAWHPVHAFWATRPRSRCDEGEGKVRLFGFASRVSLTSHQLEPTPRSADGEGKGWRSDDIFLTLSHPGGPRAPISLMSTSIPIAISVNDVRHRNLLISRAPLRRAGRPGCSWSGCRQSFPPETLAPEGHDVTACDAEDVAVGVGSRRNCNSPPREKSGWHAADDPMRAWEFWISWATRLHFTRKWKQKAV